MSIVSTLLFIAVMILVPYPMLRVYRAMEKRMQDKIKEIEEKYNED